MATGTTTRSQPGRKPRFTDEETAQIKKLPAELEKMHKQMSSIQDTLKDLRGTTRKTERQTAPDAIERDVRVGVKETLHETRTTVAQKTRSMLNSLIPHNRRDAGMLLEGAVAGAGIAITGVAQDWFGLGDLVESGV